MSFVIRFTGTADAQIFNIQDKATERRETDDPATKDVTKAKASKVSSMGNNKWEKQDNIKLSLQDRLVAAAKDSLRGLGDPGHAYAQDLRKKFGMKDA